MTLPRHPDTGFHYVVVIPFAWGPHIDYSVGYRRLAETTPWLSCVDDADWSTVYAEHRNDPRVLFVLWAPRPIAFGDRRCLIAAVYNEALDSDTSRMLTAHRDHWLAFAACSSAYDAVFVHTPGMGAEVGSRLPMMDVRVLPAGWSPWAMGGPSWEAPKHTGFAYWGSPVGRRREIVPRLHKLFPDMADLTGAYGRRLLADVNGATAALYVAHSPVQSFSTWRLWQAIATATPLVVEGTPSLLETWPFPPGLFIEIAPLDESDGAGVQQLAAVLRDPVLCRNHARAAHEGFRDWTLEFVVERYLVPAAPAIAEGL